MLDGVLDPERTIQIGIRGSAEMLWEFSYDAGMTVVHIEDVMDRGIASVIDQARARSSATGRFTYRSTSTASIRPMRRAPARPRPAA